MEGSYDGRAASLEHDLLRSVLDQDAVPQILTMARDNWGVDTAGAWAALQQQAALGRLRAYRGLGPYTAVDLTQASLEDVAEDPEVFVEPTDGTFARLNEIWTQASA